MMTRGENEYLKIGVNRCSGSYLYGIGYHLQITEGYLHDSITK